MIVLRNRTVFRFKTFNAAELALFDQLGSKNRQNMAFFVRFTRSGARPADLLTMLLLDSLPGEFFPQESSSIGRRSRPADVFNPRRKPSTIQNGHHETWKKQRHSLPVIVRALLPQCE